VYSARVTLALTPWSKESHNSEDVRALSCSECIQLIKDLFYLSGRKVYIAVDTTKIYILLSAVDFRLLINPDLIFRSRASAIACYRARSLTPTTKLRI
jgi:hypothetical protein